MSIPVTVLLSVFNGERWLEKSIPSVLEQTFGDFEFLIINDGSSDSSLEIIKKFAAEDRRIKVIDKKNTGLADSLNTGIWQAKGRWIARIDADDLCEPNRIEAQFSKVLSTNGLVLVGSGHTEIDETGQYIKTYQYPGNHWRLLDRLLKVKGFFSHSSAFYRSDIVRNLNGYRPRITYAEDFDLWLRLFEIGTVGCVNEPLVCIRKHADQISCQAGGRKQLVDSRMALVSYFLRQRGISDPVVTSSEEYFSAFRQHISDGIDINGLLEYRNYIQHIKYMLSKPDVANFTRVLVSFAKSPHFILRYFKENVIGESLSKQLSNNWR